MFAGRGATADWPGGYFYRELMDFYPDAKVLLSVREPESWERSFREHDRRHVPRRVADPPARRAPAARSTRAGAPTWSWSTACSGASRARSPPATPPRELIEQAEAHNEQVKRAVPAERLLVWKVTDGWEPLCEFLEVDVPARAAAARERPRHVPRARDYGALDALQAWRESAAAGGREPASRRYGASGHAPSVDAAAPDAASGSAAKVEDLLGRRARAAASSMRVSVCRAGSRADAFVGDDPVEQLAVEVGHPVGAELAARRTP